VAGAVDLRLIAECLEAPVDDVRALNPELRRLATPATARYSLRVPEGKGAALTSCLGSVPADKRVQFRTHVVARGQTLYSVAKKYGIRTQDLADANGLSGRKTLSVGTELIIPIEPKATAAAARRTPVTPAATTAELASSASGRVRISYRVRPGDTLGAIATQYGTTVHEIQSWNRLRGSSIAAGGTLTIYTRKF
jgi:membrane-bound lytic murein transglycosylase D